jgi:dimethylhistidine N-methyltransferase
LKIVREGTGAGSITLYDFEPTADTLCEDVEKGLAIRPRKLPPKYFYDEKGARLFESITELEAYYPTRTEISILQDHGREIGERLGASIRLVEFGSGSGEKTWLLLRHLIQPAAYIPVDISRTQLVQFALSVASEFPDLEVAPVCADYTAHFELPPTQVPTSRCVAFFPGSTLGNFEPPDAEAFLKWVADLLGPDGSFVVGLDLRKEATIIERAYNDADGVTAEFNLNLLDRINRECGADFDRAAFRHHAFFDADKSRIEMRLVSTREQRVTLPSTGPSSSGGTFSFEVGEHITTEYSHKFELEEFSEVALRAGWSLAHHWMDARAWFAVVLLERTGVESGRKVVGSG